MSRVPGIVAIVLYSQKGSAFDRSPRRRTIFEKMIDAADSWNGKRKELQLEGRVTRDPDSSLLVAVAGRTEVCTTRHYGERQVYAMLLRKTDVSQCDPTSQSCTRNTRVCIRRLAMNRTSASAFAFDFVDGHW